MVSISAIPLFYSKNKFIFNTLVAEPVPSYDSEIVN